MIQYFMSNESNSIFSLIGILVSFFGTIWGIARFKEYLPRDGGREFAHDGKLSAGKPRGAGIVFIVIFMITAILFLPIHLEYYIYLVLVGISMLTGFLDDASKNPWGEYKKGFLDLCVAALVAVTYLWFNPNVVTLAIFDISFILHPVIYGFFILVLVWASVNVTNCADGVDGLSGTLTIITLITIYGVGSMQEIEPGILTMILYFCMSILGYLWYNATPSILMMGDAGSRAMGLFIAIAILKTGSPILYPLVAFVLILDGGLGLVKVALIRFCKIYIMKNIRTPLHDHVRKVWNWSNTQTVFRFAIIQIIISIIVIFAMK